MGSRDLAREHRVEDGARAFDLDNVPHHRNEDLLVSRIEEERRVDLSVADGFQGISLDEAIQLAALVDDNYLGRMTTTILAG